jgi:CubicO group peptidase (beta-lactamase class C family)
MRKNSKGILCLLPATFALLGAGLAILPALIPRQCESNSSDLAPSARASRIETGLLPAVVIKGACSKPMTVIERMAAYEVPGVSVAFFDHGRILWTRAYGFADVASKAPVSSETLFQAGSISKPVSALGALRLVQEGKLNLDEDVNRRLRTWKVSDDGLPDMGKVTVRRILSHSAGLSVRSFPGYNSDEIVPTVVQILNGEKPANSQAIRIEVAPGTRWRYSGGGFVVLQTLVSDVTGKPFPEIMSELVFGPAGMAHSTFGQPLPKNHLAEAATPYLANGDPVKGGPHIYPEMAAAGLWTTPSDLALMAIEVRNEFAGKSSKILGQSMAREMLSRQMGTWGLGFALEGRGPSAHFLHGGGTAGYACYLETYTDSGQGFAIMTNSENGGKLIEETFRSIAKEYGWPDHHPAAILGLSLGGFTFVAVPGLVASAFWTWSRSLRQGLSRWRSILGLTSMAVSFLSWIGLAILAFSVLMNLNTDSFPSWIPLIAVLTAAGPILACALTGASRIEGIVAGLFMVASWLTSVAP